MRTFEYRLFVNKEQHSKLIQCLIQSRGISNAMLEMVKAQYEQDGTFPSKYDLEAAFKGQGAHVPATTVQMLADRLSKALKRFLAAKKNHIAGIGFPRFKKPNRWHSIQLRQYGKDCYLHEDKKQLIVPKKLGHFLKIKLHRPIEGTPKTVHLVLRADGHWYALIVCEMEPKTEHEPTECSHPDIGLDVGLKVFLADSGRDFHSKTAKRYAEQYQVIAVEHLTILNMVQNHALAKSIMDASWGAFLDILEEKAERAGHQVVRVNPRFTSQNCHNCGEIVQKSLSVRTHICPFCGYVADRDVNAAKNILNRARLGHGLQELTYTDGCSVS